jgi:hypothetical protein
MCPESGMPLQVWLAFQVHQAFRFQKLETKI